MHRPRREVPMEGQGEQGNGLKVSYNEYVAWAQGPTCGLKYHQPGVVLRDAGKKTSPKQDSQLQSGFTV
jgi:hypothetical protein